MLLNSWDGNRFQLPEIAPNSFSFSSAPASTDLDVSVPDVSDPGAFGDPNGSLGMEDPNAPSGISPGKSTGLQVAGLLTPGLFGTALGLANTALGFTAQDFNQQAAGLNRGTLDTLGESMGLTGYSGGIGGYGQAGRGGYTGAMDYADPGVAGAARGIASSAVNSAISAATAGNADAAPGYGNIGDAEGAHDDQQEDLSDPDADVSSSSAEDGIGGGDDGGDGGCVIATHAVASGAFAPEIKRQAVRWCVRNLHRKWYGEAIRRGYRHCAGKAVKAGRAHEHYSDFQRYIDFATGRRRTARGAAVFVGRSLQFFAVGLFRD